MHVHTILSRQLTYRIADELLNSTCGCVKSIYTFVEAHNSIPLLPGLPLPRYTPRAVGVSGRPDNPITLRTLNNPVFPDTTPVVAVMFQFDVLMLQFVVVLLPDAVNVLVAVIALVIVSNAVSFV